ncbi:hypothetical protein PTH_2733 [Pelotomaculum thermopropionicum SI]|uniref:Uncharacterized protein n=1 Tax=Pelotomaculum thermopropionicum (strain DSM 13744 / JCM 10971 / SI) TaxID=370438 RepID=A5CYL1_PELTS|nr:hypothetical protein PTH_2733 [Pelotomaculum thermopropionicum SI]
MEFHRCVATATLSPPISVLRGGRRQAVAVCNFLQGQGYCAHDPGAAAQLSRNKAGPRPCRLQRPGLHLPADAFPDGFAYFHNAPAKYHHSRVEQIQDAGHPNAQIAGGPVDNCGRLGVSPGGRRGYRGSVYPARIAAGGGQDLPPAAACHQFRGRPGNGRAGGHRLQAAPVAATADRSVRQDGHVADLAGTVRRAAVKLPVQDQAAAHACADGDVNHIAAAPAGPENMLAKGGQVGIVIQQNRQGKPFLQDLPDGNVIPAQVGGKMNDSPGRVQGARCAKGQGKYLLRRYRHIFPHLLHAVHNAVDHALQPPACLRGQLYFRKNPAVICRQGRVNLGAAQIYPDYVKTVHLNILPIAQIFPALPPRRRRKLPTLRNPPSF